jgi:hypothetical protein
MNSSLEYVGGTRREGGQENSSRYNEAEEKTLYR